MPRRCRGRNR